MDGSVLVILLLLTGLLLLLAIRRARATRRRSPDTSRSAFNPITPELIADEYRQLQLALARLPGPPPALAHHGYPDALQWLSLLQQAPDEAADLHEALQQQLAARGAHAELITITSLAAYAAAQQYLRAHGPVTTPQDAQPQSQARLDAGYPSEQDWYQLLTADRKEAMRVRHQLELQRARFGMAAPPTLEASIAAFQRAERRIRAEAE